MAWDFPDKSAARQWVWDRLAAEGVARFPFPPHGRIPNFAGAELAAARLLEIEPWKSDTAIKVNPDSPQPLARHYAKALAEGMGITFYVVRSREGGFLTVQISSNDCEILATVNPQISVNDPHCRPSLRVHSWAMGSASRQASWRAW